MMKKVIVAIVATTCLVLGAFADTIDLADVTVNRTIPNGSVVKGTLGKNIKISIAAGATVTLTNANNLKVIKLRNMVVNR